MTKNMLNHLKIHGSWTAGNNRPLTGTIVDFGAGRLFTDCDSHKGELLDGSPEDFRTDSGEPGDAILRRSLLPPTPESLRRGAIREAIVFAHAVAVNGFGETRAWDGARRYVVDTGEGSCGVVEFHPEGCVAAMINYDPFREYDAISVAQRAPTALRRLLLDVCRLPLLRSPHQRPITAVFWSDEGQLTGTEPWVTLYTFGGEMLRREGLEDQNWRPEARDYYELADSEVLDVAVSVAARRAASDEEVALTPTECSTLLPPSAPHRDTAMECLHNVRISLPQ
jgi:hypothetical protein